MELEINNYLHFLICGSIYLSCFRHLSVLPFVVVTSCPVIPAGCAAAVVGIAAAGVVAAAGGVAAAAIGVGVVACTGIVACLFVVVVGIVFVIVSGLPVGGLGILVAPPKICLLCFCFYSIIYFSLFLSLFHSRLQIIPKKVVLTTRVLQLTNVCEFGVNGFHSLPT